ncbi:TonB-dependent receptor plug domain-containing protein [Flavobacterium sp. RHBU_3]|uniref:TonB-dependent receptor plug domain-containing protein n=1 Tax=Flavobacterium sp. RHBU_3 TaxID=3391184 RepID=UPI0039849A5A
MTRDTRYLLLTLILFFFGAAYGQSSEQKSIELKKILSGIAQQHNIKFNFAENDVAGHSIFPPQDRLPLRAKLTYISNRTLLKFKQNGVYITVYQPPQNTPKSQTRCAFVTDETGLILGNSVIQYAQTRILAGVDGYFEFPADVTELMVEQAGYKPLRFTVPETHGDCAEIKLEPDVHELDEVVAERYLATGITLNPNGAYVIKPAKFGILPGLTEADVLQTMKQLPGINSIDETVSNINVRGGSHDENLFTWNGIRLFQTGHFFGLISALNPNLANSIEISKNGTSALYGESVSSTVNITSHSEEIGETRGNIGVNMIGVDGAARIKTSATSNVEVAARRSFTDVLDFPTYTSYSNRIFQDTEVRSRNSEYVFYQSDKEFYFYDATIQYHQIFNKKHHLYVDGTGIRNKLDFTQSTFMPYGLVIKSSNLEQTTLGGAATFKSQWNTRHSTEVGIYSSYYNVDAVNSELDFGRTTLQQNIVNDNGAHLWYTCKVSDSLSIKTGYQYNETGIKNRDLINYPQYSLEVKEVLRTHAFAAQADYTPFYSRWRAQGGLRFNYFEKFGVLIAEPRLSVSYKVSPALKIQLQAERKSQTATQIVGLQDDFLGIEKRRWVLANNADIPIQKSSQVALGAGWKHNDWLVTIDNFYKEVKGITASAQGFQDQFEGLSASGSYNVFGTEVLIQKQFKHFYVWLSYAYNHNMYHFATFNPQSFRSNFDQPHAVNNAITYEHKNLKVSLGSKLLSGRPYTAPLINTPLEDNGTYSILYDYPNGRRMRTYFQVNLSAGYTLRLGNKNQLYAGFSVINLLNRKNVLNRYYQVSDINQSIETVNTYALRRTPNAVLRFSF